LKSPEKLRKTTNAGLEHKTHRIFTQTRRASAEGNDKHELMAVKSARERVNRTIKLAKNPILKMKTDRKIQRISKRETPHCSKGHGAAKHKGREATAGDQTAAATTSSLAAAMRAHTGRTAGAHVGEAMRNLYLALGRSKRQGLHVKVKRNVFFMIG
jgi:hypothetical protein